MHQRGMCFGVKQLVAPRGSSLSLGFLLVASSIFPHRGGGGRGEYMGKAARPKARSLGYFARPKSEHLSSARSAELDIRKAGGWASRFLAKHISYFSRVRRPGISASPRSAGQQNHLSYSQLSEALKAFVLRFTERQGA